MDKLFPILLAMLAGVGLATQPPTNAALARASGSVLLAALISFAVGTVVLFVAWVAADRTPLSAVRGAPAWAWAGGLYGAYFVTAAAFAAPRLGLGVMLTLMAATQLASALAIDRYGLFDLPQVALTPGRVGGVALVVAGVLLVRRG